MPVITYVDKVNTDPGTAHGEWRAVDCNEVKTVVNQNAVVSAAINTSASVVLDFNDSVDRVFTVSASISAIKTWSLSNASNALKFRFIFQIAGIFDQTLPSSFVMADPQFDSVAHTWTPPVAGVYVAEGIFDGTTWYVTITQFL